MKILRKLSAALLSSAFLLGAAGAHAETPEAAATRAEIQKTFGFVPGFLKQAPDLALPGAWREFVAIELSPSSALPCKIKELIGLAVAAQVPCRYCVYAHSEFAELGGATPAELGEAVTMAALTRHWSTFFNGIQLDEQRFRSDVAQLVKNAKNAAASGAPLAKPVDVVDARTAFDDIKQTLGFVPEFLRKFPAEGLPGAWLELKQVEMNPATALPGKYKSLIGIAVASQIPCRYCLIADTEFAKLDGASEREISEAVAMASVVRHWSTLLNGQQTDEMAFRRDVDRLVAGAKKQISKAPVALAPRPRAASH